MKEQTFKKRARLTVATVDAQLNKAFGNISAVAAAFGVTRSAVYDYIKRHPTLKQTMEDAREKLVDDAESALHAAVLGKEGWAVCFTLKTQGKDRGYIEKQHVEQNGTLIIKVQYGDDGSKGTDDQASTSIREADRLPQ